MKDLLLVFFAGLVVGWFLKQASGQTTKVSEISNTEKWDLWESEDGHVHAVVKRRVKR